MSNEKKSLFTGLTVEESAIVCGGSYRVVLLENGNFAVVADDGETFVLLNRHYVAVAGFVPAF